MPNELNIALANSGLTVTAQRYQSGAAVGSAISLSEISTSGVYTGNMTGAAGTYQLAFISAGKNVGSGQIIWDGTAEVPVSTLTTTNVQSALTAQGFTSARAGNLDNLDATVSSRLAPSGTLATVTTLTNAPTVPSASAIASQVRTELSVELGRLDTAISTRLAGSAYTAPATAAEITSAVWAAADKTGYSLTIAERSAIAAAVESSILNENDGQQILNAIVGAIGNTNLDQIALVAAIRSDLERAGGKIDSIPAAPTAAANASAVWAAGSRTLTSASGPTAAENASAVWAAGTRTLTSASGPTAAEIRQEIDANSTKLDASVSSRLAASAYTAPTAAPTAAANAAAVRSELSVELGRIDASVSSRATPANIPASDIAAIKAKTDALDSERLANVATTNIVGTLLAQANS